MSFIELLREYEEIFADEQEDIEYDDIECIDYSYDMF